MSSPAVLLCRNESAIPFALTGESSLNRKNSISPPPAPAPAGLAARRALRAGSGAARLHRRAALATLPIALSRSLRPRRPPRVRGPHALRSPYRCPALEGIAGRVLLSMSRPKELQTSCRPSHRSRRTDVERCRPDGHRSCSARDDVCMRALVRASSTQRDRAGPAPPPASAGSTCRNSDSCGGGPGSKASTGYSSEKQASQNPCFRRSPQRRSPSSVR